MTAPLTWLAVLGLVVLIAAYCWHSRRHPRPCPWWMRWILDNPRMNAVAGPAVLTKRMQRQPGMRVLDVGCGPGRLTIALARHVRPQGRVTAFDVQEEMLQVLRGRLAHASVDNVELVQGLAGAGDMRWENVYGRAVLVTVLGEIPNKLKALQEVHRALKPGGILSVTEVLPDPDYLSRATGARLTTEAGFEFVGSHGNRLAFTINVRQPSATAETRDSRSDVA